MPLPQGLRRRLADWLRQPSGAGEGDTEAGQQADEGAAEDCGAKEDAAGKGCAAAESEAAAAQPAADDASGAKDLSPLDADRPARLVDMRAVAELLRGEVCARVADCDTGAAAEARFSLAALADALNLEPPPKEGAPGALLLDIETLGLRSAPVFLVGLLNTSTREAVQLLAGDHAGEAALLARAVEVVAEAPVVVTYNGASFDLPYLRDRLRYWRLGDLSVSRHLDLLLRLRRTRPAWPNLRLGTVEERALGRVRSGDIDPAELPKIYADFVRSGDVEHVVGPMAHNLMDLWSCHELLHLLAPRADHCPWTEDAD